MAPEPAASAPTPASVHRVVLASFLGTVIEWYDFFYTAQRQRQCFTSGSTTLDLGVREGAASAVNTIEVDHVGRGARFDVLVTRRMGW